mmetsp:Transcript_12282/g.38935  ORF Transcript_12282/g.38935 Transcript_12282/m.38935 type:complete len:211 (+) Transcript_12282:668-1300(+)
MTSLTPMPRCLPWDSRSSPSSDPPRSWSTRNKSRTRPLRRPRATPAPTPRTWPPGPVHLRRMPWRRCWAWPARRGPRASGPRCTSHTSATPTASPPSTRPRPRASTSRWRRARTTSPSALRWCLMGTRASSARLRSGRGRTRTDSTTPLRAAVSTPWARTTPRPRRASRRWGAATFSRRGVVSRGFSSGCLPLGPGPGSEGCLPTSWHGG